jgi:hypothetical protein
MRGRGARISVVAVAVAAFTILTAVPALAADQTPPNLTVPIRGRFVVGNQVERYLSAPSDGTVEYATNILEHLTWSATDNVGVCEYALTQLFAGDFPEPVFDGTPNTDFTVAVVDYDGDFGGGGDVTVGYAVTARDCAGNETTKVIASRVGVTQENGDTAYEEAPGHLAYSSGWSGNTCECLWGHTRRTTKQWANVRYTRTYERGDQIALVMSKGPDHGRARILLDGVRVRTIDTHAGADTDRIVVWQRGMSAGTHTIKVTNLATSGRPEIEVDAFIYSVP